LRAALAAHLGEKELAVSILQQALDEGGDWSRLHSRWYLAPLWAYEPFEELARPRG
jgi:hypothetical protein